MAATSPRRTRVRRRISLYKLDITPFRVYNDRDVFNENLHSQDQIYAETDVDTNEDDVYMAKELLISELKDYLVKYK